MRNCPNCGKLQLKIEALQNLIGDADERALKAVRQYFGLSPNEAHALIKLAVAVGKPVTSTEIVASRPIKYNEMEAFALDRLGKVTVAHLREILGEDMIKTVWGQGYIATELCINAVAEACKYIL